MSDGYTPTTENVRDGYAYDPEAEYHDPVNYAYAVARAKREFDRWHANERADAVMGFATHYLPHALWVKAKQYADDIREGNA